LYIFTKRSNVRQRRFKCNYLGKGNNICP
jgi:hypothetical protein